MAREIVAFTWCDLCMEREIKEPGEEFTIQIGTLKARVIALCERDRKEFLDPLTDLLKNAPTVEAAGSVQPKPAKKRVAPPATVEVPAGMVATAKGELVPADDAIWCLACPEGERVPSATKSAFASHLKRTHDMGEPQYRRDFLGDTDVVEEKCEDCGETFFAASNRMSQVMGVHRQRSHAA